MERLGLAARIHCPTKSTVGNPWSVYLTSKMIMQSGAVLEAKETIHFDTCLVMSAKG